MTSDLNILVISDIHAFNGNPDDAAAPSYCSTWPQFQTNDVRNPFRTIPALIAQERLSVDWVVCPGDLADRADPAAQGVAWSALETLKRDVGAKLLIGTAGNHDIDSRLAFDEIDIKGALQSLNPIFPGLNENQCDFYWSRNFAILEEPDVLVVILNSSAFHGINSDKRTDYKEYEHGRVSDRTIDAIIKRLPKESKKLNILLAHHHFYKNERIAAKDYSTIINGTKLLDVLATATSRPWFVLHGHMHYPEISYGKGDSTSSPIIFSAGSFSRKLHELRQESANQFYHLKFPFDKYQQLGWETCGICRAWDWVPGEGWKAARGVARIPKRSGFGCRASKVNLATQIYAIVDGSQNRVTTWEKIVSKVPELEFILPTDLERVIQEIRNKKQETYDIRNAVSGRLPSLRGVKSGNITLR